jgi:hypothetical protein
MVARSEKSDRSLRVAPLHLQGGILLLAIISASVVAARINTLFLELPQARMPLMIDRTAIFSRRFVGVQAIAFCF